MRPRKVAPLSKDKSPPLEDFTDAFPSDDIADNETAPFDDDTREIGRICVDCGGDGRGHDGCAHREIARFHSTSRAVSEAVLRLRRAAAEHRAASRALRALVMTEIARDRAEFEPSIEPEPEPEPGPLAMGPAISPAREPTQAAEAALETSEPAKSAPCPRCAERDAEAAREIEPMREIEPKPLRRRPRLQAPPRPTPPRTAQQMLLFGGETGS